MPSIKIFAKPEFFCACSPKSDSVREFLYYRSPLNRAQVIPNDPSVHFSTLINNASSPLPFRSAPPLSGAGEPPCDAFFRTPVDFDLFPHENERAAAPAHPEHAAEAEFRLAATLLDGRKRPAKALADLRRKRREEELYGVWKDPVGEFRGRTERGTLQEASTASAPTGFLSGGWEASRRSPSTLSARKRSHQR